MLVDLSRFPRLALTCRILAVALGCLLFLQLMAWLMRPDLPTVPPAVDQADLAQVTAARERIVDRDNPPRIQVTVDYADTDAAWRPTTEAPVLQQMVAAGDLPPLAERMPAEPLVLQPVDELGKHGGTWQRYGPSPAGISNRMSATTLIRWSPCGYPLVPHVAKDFSANDDGTEYRFTLRKGMRWSDGHPFTTRDIAYYFSHEVTDPGARIDGIEYLTIGGKTATLEVADELSFTIRFPAPNSLFLVHLASARGLPICAAPAHYLERYHPTKGDEALIKQAIADRHLGADNSATRKTLYKLIKQWDNPLCPRLWPWLYRTYQTTPPYSLVRNPYYFAVDTDGAQLPYVDRMLIVDKNRDLLPSAAAAGEFPFQEFKVDQHTLLMANRERGNYRILRWLRADRSENVLHINQNRAVDPADPVGVQRRELLRNATFRQALSLAIDRQQVVDALYYGETKPAQVAPGPASWWYHEGAYGAYASHEPDRANTLLDSIGLDQRDSEGFRTYPDGSRLQLVINYPGWFWEMNAQFVTEDWAAVGIRAIPRVRDDKLFYTEKAAGLHDISCFTGNNEFFPIIEPRCHVPVSHESNFGIAYARWYKKGGLNAAVPASEGVEEPPAGSPIRRVMELYDAIKATTDREQQRALMHQIYDITAEQVWTISLCTAPDRVMVARNDFINIPDFAVWTFDFIAPGMCAQETWSFTDANESDSTLAQIAGEIRTATPEVADASAPTDSEAPAANGGSSILGWLFFIALILAIGLACLRHPFIARRLLLMIPTLAIVSVVVFTIIELPPGDYADYQIMERQRDGETVSDEEITNLREQYFLNDPTPVRFARWLGLNWFISFDAADKGLIQGYLGRSMSLEKPVNDVVGDRIMLTFLISLGTILFTWAVAIPTGIYSAVRQYSPGDYLFTTLGFLGMCIPSFLLAILFIYMGQEWFGVSVTGLFSPEYAAEPHWSGGKVLDLLSHIWVPITILGVTGTAGMIRVMRGNLLDELKKPYVTTARAKGVRPLKLLVKYPVRIALNPFIAGIGGLFPQLVSGGAICAIVLALPTVGPLMLTGLMNEDTYLAGSMLMVLSLLGIIGTLISDLLLMWLDPRIRMDGGRSK